SHHGQRRRLARARDSIQTDYLLPREKNLIDRLALSGIQFRVPVFGLDANSSINQHRIAVPAPVAFLHLADGLALHAQHGPGGVLLASVFGSMLPGIRLWGAKLARLDSPVELLPNLGKVRLAHASAERRRHNRAFALDRRTLEEVIAGIGHGHL